MLVNCLLTDNCGAYPGGTAAADSLLLNCTIVTNVGVVALQNCHVENSMVYYNSPGNGDRNSRDACPTAQISADKTLRQNSARSQ
jgi:hypothetical protein